jgi:hypothetical protein
MEGMVGCGKPSTILERVVSMLELSFCLLHTFEERLLWSVRVEFDRRSRGAGGVREAGWLDSVVTAENRGKGAKRH